MCQPKTSGSPSLPPVMPAVIRAEITVTGSCAPCEGLLCNLLSTALRSHGRYDRLRKPFDIVVFGASGYTGRLVAEYLDAEYGDSDLRWAMAGCSLDKLTVVRSEMGISDTIALLEVDVDDPASVTAWWMPAKSSRQSVRINFMAMNWLSSAPSEAQTTSI